MTKDEQIAKLRAVLKQAHLALRQEKYNRELSSGCRFVKADTIELTDKSLSAIDAVLGDNNGAVAAVTPVSESNAAIPLDGGQNNTTKDGLVRLARPPAPIGDTTSVGIQSAVHPTTSQSDECRKAFEEWRDTLSVKYAPAIEACMLASWQASRVHRDAELVRLFISEADSSDNSAIFNGLYKAASLTEGGRK